MYNFLDSKLSPKVSASVPCTDNYEVENLISEDSLTKSRGFLAYCFVKPPVEILFELICPINIHYIVLSTTLNTSKYTTIEVLVKNLKGDFAFIAYSRFNDPGTVFYNDRIYSTNNLPPNIDQTYHLSFFKRNAFRSFTTATNVKIRILKTEGSVPCVGKVEVWGKPSKTCSLTTVNTIEHLMQKSLHSTDHSSKRGTTEKQICLSNDFEIPEDFKDALTFEIMSLPITLPSGNTIDQTTLEKCVENETSYGRMPSDPFTGQKFTNTRKPVFNTSLKHRIDMFLLQHSHRSETFLLKRTLGKINNMDSIENKISKKQKVDDVFPKDFKQIKVCDTNSEIRVNKSNNPDEILNEAIQKITKNKRFICFTNEEALKVDAPNECLQCSIRSYLYILPCSHLYCKNCLLNVCKILKCENCLKPFSKNDPKKFHAY